MRKKIMTLAVVTALSLCLAACNAAEADASVTTTTVKETTTAQETTTIKETTTAQETTTVKETTTAQETTTVKETTTPTPEPTTPAPIPYGEKNGFVIENKTEYELSFVHYVTAWDSNEEATYPGLTTENESYKLVLDSVTQKKSDEEGYTTFTVAYHADYGVKENLDIRKGNDVAPIQTITPIFSVCDYYTGLSGINNLAGENGVGETVVNWQEKDIRVQCSTQKTLNAEWGEWCQESDNIYSMMCYCREDYTLVITVPDGYDGIMLCVKEGGFEGQGKADYDKIYQGGNRTEELLTDGEKADDYYFIRLTDVAK